MKNWLWFGSSFAPLWLMLALRFKLWWLEIPCSLLAAVSIGLVLYLLHRRSGDLPSGSEITVEGDAGAEVSGYLASYLLPFLTVGKPGWRDVAAYVTFVAVAGAVYVRSDMIQVNPVLYLMRWRVLRGSVPVGASHARVFVITRRDRRVGECCFAERFSDRVYIDHAPRN